MPRIATTLFAFALGMPNIPACTPLASDTVFRNGFEFSA